MTRRAPAGESLNLIPADVLLRLETRRRARRWMRIAVITSIAAALSPLALRPLAARDHARLERAAARREAERHAAAGVEALRAERDRLARIVVERGEALPPATLLDLFTALESSMPAPLSLRALNAEPAAGAASPLDFEVHLEGRAPATDLVAAFLFRLAGRSDVRSTELEFSHRESEESGGGVSFAVRLRYHPEGRSI